MEKKTYVNPTTELIEISTLEAYKESLMNTGSVFGGNGSQEDNIGSGTGGGTAGNDGFVWGDARAFDSSFSLWED